MTMSCGTLMSPVVWRSLSDVQANWPGCVVTTGVCDGFHRGHIELVERARHHADRLGLATVLMTFDPHPLSVTRPDRAPRQLVSLDERARLAHDLGVDVVLIVPFTAEFATITAEQFICEILVTTLRVQAVVVGENFHFGAGGRGDVGLLKQAGHEHNFHVEGVPLVEYDGRVCSSTEIRRGLAAGDISGATQLLGRPKFSPGH